MTIQYEDLVVAIKEWSTRYKILASESKFEILTLELEGLIQALEDPAIASNLDNFKLEKKDDIDLYGLGQSVLSLYEEDYTEKEISETLSLESGLSISSKDVETYVDKYKKGNISFKRQANENSIFNTRFQMENLMVHLQSLLQDMQMYIDDPKQWHTKNSSPHEVMVSILKETRMLAKDAADIIKAYANIEQTQNVIQIILENIPDEYKPRLYKQLRENSALFKAFNGS